MTFNGNNCSCFLITIWILLMIQSSLLISAEIIDYPSFVDAPNSWRKTISFDFSFWEVAGVKPILVNGMFVCGFHCSLVAERCLFAVSIFNNTSVFNTSADGNNSSFSLQVVWSANRNNPVDYQAQLELTPEGGLILKDGEGVVVWSAKEAGKSISRLNLSAEGNLMLFDKTNSMVWQSFDYPTDSLVRGQRLVSGQKLRASVSPFNSSEGLYAFAIVDGYFIAYMDAYPSPIYYKRGYLVLGNSVLFYDEFQTERFSLSVPDSVNFIQLGSDGQLRAYEWNETDWEGSELLDISRCSYPLACGKYGVCSEGGCGCPDAAPQSQTTYFRPINYTRLDLGCSAISPISCELSLHQSFLELQSTSDEPFEFNINMTTYSNISKEDCKEACLKNCSCKAAMYTDSLSGSYCHILSEVMSFKISDSTAGYEYNYSHYDNSAFIKVQNFSSALSPDKNPSSPEFPKRKRQDMALILGLTLGVVSGVFLLCIFCFLLIKKGFKEANEEDYLDSISGMPTRFSFEELKNITKNFSKKLGEGGFGTVFHGTLPSGSEVAVKHLDGFGPVKKSFIAEVQTIGSINHFNLVSLVGFCAEKYNRLLVYEYMRNGSLDRWIFHKNQVSALGWQIRKKIIADIAKGLAYLHEECTQKIIHLDIKPQNILLDENFNAKVSDFGLSKLIGRDQSQVVTTMRGTPGYMAPEWLSSIITEKADVYSFGIVVLEILCGRKNVDGSQQEEDRHLLSVFRRRLEEGRLADLVDKCCEDMQSNAEEVVQMMKIGAWCLQAEYGRRPSMSTVVKVLEGLVDFVGNLNENFLNELKVGEGMETFASIVLPSMLSGPR